MKAENKNAIEIIKKMVADGKITQETAEQYFPELKESEDERIRKTLIYHYQGDGCLCTNEYRIDYKEIRAWLEKQGEQKETLCDKCKKEQPSHSCQDITALGRCALEKQGEQNPVVTPKFRIGDIITPKGKKEYYTIIDIVDGWYEFREKHINGGIPIHYQFGWELVEQKHDDKVEPKFKVGDKIQYSKGCGTIMTIEKVENGEYIFGNNLGHTTIESGNKWHLVEQKPIDKVEPKFKVGDYIISNNNSEIICRITGTGINELGNPDYVCEHVGREKEYNGRIYTMRQDKVDVNFRLWTIQDAKDGDVLATDDGNIFVFDGTVEEAKYPFAYYGLTRRRFESYDRRLPFTHNNVHPATKEQCDLLFQKMHEAGYEWDAEKKELKKIEKKPAEWEPQTGDTFRKKGTTSPTYYLCNKREDGITFDFVENREVGSIAGGEITIFALKYSYELVKRPKPIEEVIEEETNRVLTSIQKPAWSEEDEKYWSIVIAEFSKCAGKSVSKDEWMHCNDWLNSLRGRVQPKQEWSEEDEKMHDFAIRAVGLCRQYAINHQVNGYSKLPDVPRKYEELQDWLKSLGPQINVTDEELALAKKDAYNDALDKIEYHSGEPTFDDGWSAAIWYLKKRNVQPQNRWKPSDEQMGVIEAVINNRSFQRRHLDSLYEQLKKLREE